MHMHTLSSMTLSRFVPAIWKLVSLDDFSLSMKSLTLASWTHIRVQDMKECTSIANGETLNSLARHFCRNLASTSSSSMSEYPVLYGPNAHGSIIILTTTCIIVYTYIHVHARMPTARVWLAYLSWMTYLHFSAYASSSSVASGGTAMWNVSTHGQGE